MPFNRLNHSAMGKILPRFKLKINSAPESALNIIENHLTKDKTVSGERSGKLIFLRTPSWSRHYWSPEMTVRVEVEEFTDFTTVSCLIGPRQSVWALFAFLHIVLILTSVFGGIYGFVYFKHSGDPSWLWIIPCGIIASFSVFLTSKIGQKKGRDQMLHLVSFLYHSLIEITPIERIER